MSQGKGRGKRNYRRRNFIVDKPLQYSIMFTALAAFVLVSLVFIGGHFALPTEEVFDAFTGEQTRRMILTLNTSFFALTFVTLGIILVILSHRVAGPAMVFDKAMRGMLKGKFKERTKIREKDYLQGLSDVLGELQDHMKVDHERRHEFLRNLHQALESKDLTMASRLLDQYSRACDGHHDDPDPEVAAPEATSPAEEPKEPVASGS